MLGYGNNHIEFITLLYNLVANPLLTVLCRLLTFKDAAVPFRRFYHCIIIYHYDQYEDFEWLHKK